MLEWMRDDSVVHDLHRDFASMTIDDCRGFIERSISDYDVLNTAPAEQPAVIRNLHLAITDASHVDPDEYLGTVSLKHIDTTSHTAEFGITIRTCAMGTGIAHEAMKRIMAKARDELDINCVYWCVSPDNARALRFYDKHGYLRVKLADYFDIYQLIQSSGDYSAEDIDLYVWYVADLSAVSGVMTQASETDSKSAAPASSAPDVSVYMMTYYHEKYVRQAIESVLAQQTSYKFELVISDDCSQDGTADILREYAERYPDIIRININETNLGIPTNIFKARTMCRGRYITNLSGDDYWIDEKKIDTETRFLDEHPEYSAVACRIELRMDDSDSAYGTIPEDTKLLNRPYTISEYEKCLPLGTHGLFMRNFFLTEEGRAYFAQAREISEFVDDAVDEVLLLRKGPIYVLDITSDAHRVVASDLEKKNYNSRYSRLEKFRHHIDLLNGMSSRWSDEIDFSNWYANYSATGILSMLISRDFAGYRAVLSTIPPRYRTHIRWIPYAIKLITARLRRKI